MIRGRFPLLRGAGKGSGTRERGGGPCPMTRGSGFRQDEQDRQDGEGLRAWRQAEVLTQSAAGSTADAEEEPDGGVLRPGLVSTSSDLRHAQTSSRSLARQFSPLASDGPRSRRGNDASFGSGACGGRSAAPEVAGRDSGGASRIVGGSWGSGGLAFGAGGAGFGWGVVDG